MPSRGQVVCCAARGCWGVPWRCWAGGSMTNRFSCVGKLVQIIRRRSASTRINYTEQVSDPLYLEDLLAVWIIIDERRHVLALDTTAGPSSWMLGRVTQSKLRDGEICRNQLSPDCSRFASASNYQGRLTSSTKQLTELVPMLIQVENASWLRRTGVSLKKKKPSSNHMPPIEHQFAGKIPLWSHCAGATASCALAAPPSPVWRPKHGSVAKLCFSCCLGSMLAEFVCIQNVSYGTLQEMATKQRQIFFYWYWKLTRNQLVSWQ